jgi:energy-coupling factor transporter ATP-binding protein EcfA2
MIIESVEVKRFQSVLADTLHCASFTALVGANGAGKSTFLRAVEVFYTTTAEIDLEDFYNRETANEIVIGITFKDIVYEFRSKQLIGTFKGKFDTRPLSPHNCDIYSAVKKREHPVLISTSRHVRQMAFDIRDLAYDSQQHLLRGTSRAVAGDLYQLRIHAPEGFTARSAELAGNIPATMRTDGRLLRWTSSRQPAAMLTGESPFEPLTVECLYEKPE